MQKYLTDPRINITCDAGIYPTVLLYTDKGTQHPPEYNDKCLQPLAQSADRILLFSKTIRPASVETLLLRQQYTCTKKWLVPAESDNFWSMCMKLKAAIYNYIQPILSFALKKKDFKTRDTFYEVLRYL